jgi:multidrug efflux pump subunit AcrA (membrane-fusion protein)
MSVEQTSTAGGMTGAASSPRAGGDPPPYDPRGELEKFLCSLLAFQCSLVDAAAAVVFLASSPARRGGVVARYVAPGGDAVSSDALADVSLLRRLERIGQETIERAGSGALVGTTEAVAVAREGLYEATATHRVLAVPLTADGRVEGASIVLVPFRGGMDAEEALERLALSAARFESFLWRQQCLAEAGQKAMLRETLELLDASQQGATVAAMGSLLCDELQRRFGCTRVSIGLAGAGPIRLAAVSGVDELDRKGPAVEALEAAMEECADQDTEIVYPAPATTDPAQRRVTQAHESLARRFGPAAVLSLPLRVEGDLVGVATLERDEADPFPAAALPLLRLVAEFIGPSLWTRRLADRGLAAVARDRAVEVGQMLVGPRHTGAKLIGVLALLTLVAAALPVWPRRVSAGTEVKAAVARSIAAPFVGYLQSVNVKPGDAVEAGTLLARMDTADLELELAEVRSKRDSLRTELDDAMATGEMGKAAILGPQVREAEARMAFIRDHIAKADVRSPFAGRVSRGDLEAFVGARVEPTQMLFELVTDERVVTVQVDERDVRLVKPGQIGMMTTKALPGETVPIVIERVNPSAQAVRGANVYLAEARILEAPAWLRPGQTGRAKLDVTGEDGSRERISAMSMVLGPLADELRLRLWW